MHSISGKPNLPNPAVIASDDECDVLRPRTFTDDAVFLLACVFRFAIFGRPVYFPSRFLSSSKISSDSRVTLPAPKVITRSPGRRPSSTFGAAWLMSPTYDTLLCPYLLIFY